jgi:hypothetical protein
VDTRRAGAQAADGVIHLAFSNDFSGPDAVPARRSLATTGKRPAFTRRHRCKSREALARPAISADGTGWMSPYQSDGCF